MSGDHDTPELSQDKPFEKAPTTQENGEHPTDNVSTVTTPTNNANPESSTAGPAANGTTDTTPKSESINDPEAQAMVIESLKAQILELSTQVTQMNGKLIRSYDRISDLEDSLHSSTTKLDSSTTRIATLEQERTQHISALDAGLLVEKSHVTAELTRLMEKASEEEIHRGEAENRRKDIEKELDDLSASLFEQANVMVRDARAQQAISERKAREAEETLKTTEEAVRVMQLSMQQLQHDKDEAIVGLRDIKGKTRSVEKPDPVSSSRLLNSHLPYHEFLSFVTHLRSLHTPASQPPSVTTLLPLPFLARLLTEDSEPTVRLDLAPSLNWLSRRSVLAAIHSGQLSIEPMATSALLSEPSVAKQISSSSPTSSPHPFSSSGHNIPCALCGTPIFGQTDSHHNQRPPIHPSLTLLNGVNGNGGSWSTSLFKRSAQTGSRDPSPPPHAVTNIKQVYVFRLAAPMPSFQYIPLPTSLPSALQSQGPASPTSAYHANTPSTSKTPTPSHTPSRYNSPQANSSTIYPLCTNHWCLNRLRSTCTLWAFVRTGIVDKVWEEDIPVPPVSNVTSTSSDTDEKLSGLKAVSRKDSTEEPQQSMLWANGLRVGHAKQIGTGFKVMLPQLPKSVKTTNLSTLIRYLPPRRYILIALKQAYPLPPPPLPKRNEGRRPVPPPPTKETAPPTTEKQPSSSEPQPSDIPPVDSSVKDPINFDNPPLSPRNVPLPDSRPATPTGQSFPRASKSNLNGSPSRSASPAPGPGAIPPPLPRRAVGRSARPLSAIGADALSASRPSTPAGAPGSDSSEAKDPAPPTQIAEHVEDQTLKDVSGINPTDRQDVNTIPEEVVPPSEDVPNQTNVTDAKPLDSSNDVADGSPPAYEKHGEVQTSNSDAHGAQTQETEARSSEDSDKLDSDEGHDKAGFVGDSSWEERAWREIVRLREDMFWARIGALR
ncbi:hypothetical protein ONZ45_g4158 [Pleurotus djamor]|nr:hypothetical protein ONZ45_g4158 [Pleurotus djamor]